MKQENNQTEVPMAARGIWTPAARVICINCHGNVFNFGNGDVRVLNQAEMSKRHTPVPLDDGKLITKCEECRGTIQLYNSIAAEHNLVLALREAGIDANMQQTGGMNSRCEIKTISGGFFIVTFNWDGDGIYSVIELDMEETRINSPLEFFSESHDEVLKHMKTISSLMQIVR